MDRIIEELKRNHRRNKVVVHSGSVIEELKRDYRERSLPTLDISGIDSKYYLSVNDDSVHNPFVLSPSLVPLARKCGERSTSREGKAKAIYDWIERNIEYGRNNRGYSNSREVLDDGRGVCGEMAFLYISMARSIGLESSYVSVDRDFRGKKVSHACAVVDTERGDVYVDPAYHTYDIEHKQFEKLNDLEVLIRFNQWRDTGVVFGVKKKSVVDWFK